MSGRPSCAADDMGDSIEVTSRMSTLNSDVPTDIHQPRCHCYYVTGINTLDL